MNMLLTFLATAVVLVVPQSFSAVETKLNETWEIFKLKFGKKYDLATDNMRRIIWESNLKYIQHHNDGYKLGKYSYTLGMNQFTDLSNAEYRKIYLSPKLIKRNLTKSHFTHFKNVYSLPTSVDWRTQGYVTAVKDQGQCGSCWAFSTTGSLEGQNKRKTGNLVSFSEQQLIDCSQAYGNYGCSGGLMIFGFEYVEDNGIEAEADYPYTANDDDCQYDESKAVGTCTGYEFIEYGNEQDLAAAVATIGPISIAIDASNLSFQLYQDGVYDEPSCSSDSLDHGVLAIGYGNEHCIDYWLVKNSWGTTWGINGYIKMSKDKNNQCGVATFASYPLV